MMLPVRYLRQLYTIFGASFRVPPSLNNARTSRCLVRTLSRGLVQELAVKKVLLPSKSRVAGENSSGFNIYQSGRLVLNENIRTKYVCPVRSFHVSPVRCVPPVLWLFLKPAAKLGAILSGRSIRKWWKSMPAKQQGHFWSKVRQNWYWLILAGAGLCMSAVVYYETHLEQTPITGRKRFIIVTHNQFLKIAEAEVKGYLETFKDKLLPDNNPYEQRVSRIAQRLLEANPEIKDLMHFEKWKVFVINEPDINAFVLPTGYIFVFLGILGFTHNDDQLAMIIAHEMAHALLSHGIEQASFTQLLDFIIISTMSAIWCIMPNDGFSLVSQWFYHKFIEIVLGMPYSRNMEKEADKVGLQLAAKACYDVREGSVFWARMNLNETFEGQQGHLPEWLSTHPSHQKRSEYIDFLLPKALELRETAKCPVLPARDPRKMITELSSFVDQHQTAKRAGQNLKRVQLVSPYGQALQDS